MKTIEKFLTPGLLTFFRGIICSFSGAVLLGVINYLIRRILVQNLSQTDFGFFYSMFALFNMLATFFQFGIQQVAPILTARYIAQRQEKRINCLISFLFFAAGLTGLVLMCILFVGLHGNLWVNQCEIHQNPPSVKRQSGITAPLRVAFIPFVV